VNKMTIIPTIANPPKISTAIPDDFQIAKPAKTVSKAIPIAIRGAFVFIPPIALIARSIFSDDQM